MKVLVSVSAKWERLDRQFSLSDFYTPSSARPFWDEALEPPPVRREPTEFSFSPDAATPKPPSSRRAPVLPTGSTAPSSPTFSGSRARSPHPIFKLSEADADGSPSKRKLDADLPAKQSLLSLLQACVEWVLPLPLRILCLLMCVWVGATFLGIPPSHSLCGFGASIGAGNWISRSSSGLGILVRCFSLIYLLLFFCNPIAALRILLAGVTGAMIPLFSFIRFPKCLLYFQWVSFVLTASIDLLESNRSGFEPLSSARQLLSNFQQYAESVNLHTLQEEDSFVDLEVDCDSRLLMGSAVHSCVIDASWRLKSILRTRRFFFDSELVLHFKSETIFLILAALTLVNRLALISKRRK